MMLQLYRRSVSISTSTTPAYVAYIQPALLYYTLRGFNISMSLGVLGICYLVLIYCREIPNKVTTESI